MRLIKSHSQRHRRCILPTTRVALLPAAAGVVPLSPTRVGQGGGNLLWGQGLGTFPSTPLQPCGAVVVSSSWRAEQGTHQSTQQASQGGVQQRQDPRKHWGGVVRGGAPVPPQPDLLWSTLHPSSVQLLIHQDFPWSCSGIPCPQSPAASTLINHCN